MRLECLSRQRHTVPIGKQHHLGDVKAHDNALHCWQ